MVYTLPVTIIRLHISTIWTSHVFQAILRGTTGNDACQLALRSLHRLSDVDANLGGWTTHVGCSALASQPTWMSQEVSKWLVNGL